MERIWQQPRWEQERGGVVQIRGHLRDLWKGLNCSSTDFADGADNTTSFLERQRRDVAQIRGHLRNLWKAVASCANARRTVAARRQQHASKRPTAFRSDD